VERYLLLLNPVTNRDLVEGKSPGRAKGSISPERNRTMVAKKRKTTKKVKDLKAKRMTAAQEKKVTGGNVGRKLDDVHHYPVDLKKDFG